MSGLDFHESGVRIKKWMTMMDSMTESELDETKSFAPSRIIRIARGSGHYPQEVVELLEQFKLMQTTMQKTMKKNKKMGKGSMDLHNMDAVREETQCLSRACPFILNSGHNIKFIPILIVNTAFHCARRRRRSLR